MRGIDRMDEDLLLEYDDPDGEHSVVLEDDGRVVCP